MSDKPNFHSVEFNFPDEKPSNKGKVNYTPIEFDSPEPGINIRSNEQAVDLSEYSDYFTKGDVYLGDSMDETRAQGQGAGEKWAHGAAKMGVIAATTIADGIIGTAVGLGDMVVGENKDENGERQAVKGSDFWNNPFSNAMNDVNAWAEKALPNYYTKAEQTDPFYKHMGANFWADKVLKNMGFMVGTVVDGMITGGATMYLTGAKSATRTIAKGLVSKALKGAELEAKTADIIKDIRTGKLALSSLATEMANDAKIIRRGTTVSQVAGSILASGGEARIEAIGAMKEFQDEMRAAHPEMSEDQINAESLKVGNSVFGMNMAILSISNYTQFASAFSGAAKAQSSIGNLLSGNVKDGFKVARASTKFGRGAENTWNVAKALKNPITEGLEESNQMVAGTTAKDFYSHQLDPENRKEFNSFFSSMLHGIKDTYGSSEGWENFTIGAITGLIGSPTFGMSKGDYKAFGIMPMAGGVVGDIKSNFGQYKEAQKMVTALNAATKKPEFLNMYNGMLSSYGYAKDAKQALEDGDKFAFENASTGKFINDVLTFSKAGKLEDLMDHINSFKNNDIEQLREMLNVPADKKDPAKAVVNPLQEMSDDELKSYMNGKIDKLNQISKEVVKLKTDLDTKFPGMDDTVKDQLIQAFIGSKDADARMDELGKEVAKLIEGSSGSAIKEANTEMADFHAKGVEITKLLNRHRAIKGWQTRRDAKIADLSEKLRNADPDQISKTLDEYSKELDTLMAEKAPLMNIPEHKNTNTTRARFETVKSEYNSLLLKKRSLESKLAQSTEEFRSDIEKELKSVNDKLAASHKELSSIDKTALTGERNLLADHEKEIQHAFDVYYKHGDQNLEHKKDEFFQQFKERVNKNLDLIDEINTSTINSVAKNPETEKDVARYLADMASLAQNRANFANQYSAGLTQNGSKAMAGANKKLQEGYLKSMLDEFKKRYWDGRRVKNIHTNQKGTISTIGDEIYLQIDGGKKELVEYNQEFAEAWLPTTSITAEVAETIPTEEELAAAKHDILYFKGEKDKIYVKGRLVSYKEHNYLQVRSLNKKGEVVIKYHLVLNDGTITPTGWTSNNVETEEGTKELEKDKEMQFAGTVYRYAGKDSLYSYVSISELSDRKQVDDTMTEEEADNAEKLESEDVTEAESDEFIKEISSALKQERPVFEMAIAEEYDEKTKKATYKTHPISDAELISQIYEQFPDIVEQIKSQEKPGSGVWVELKDIRANKSITANKDKTIRGYIKFPRKEYAPPISLTLKTKLKGKGFTIKNSDDIKAILATRSKTKTGNTKVKYKGKIYFLTFTKYPEPTGKRAFFFYPAGRTKTDGSIATSDYINYDPYEVEENGEKKTLPAGKWISKLADLEVVKETEKGYVVKDPKQIEGKPERLLFIPKEVIKYAINENGTLGDKSEKVSFKENSKKISLLIKEDPEETIHDTDPQPSTKSWTVPKRVLATLFRGLAGNIGQVVDGGVMLNEDESQLRYGKFVNSKNLASGNYKVKLVKPSAVLGEAAWKKKREDLSKKTDSFAGYSESELDKTIWAVFVNDSGDYINSEGHVITEEQLEEEGIYSSLTLPTLFSKRLVYGVQQPKYADNLYKQEDLDKELAIYEKEYDSLLDKMSKETVELKVIGKGQGIAVNLKDNETQTLDQYYGTEDIPADIHIEICTTGTIHHEGIDLTGVRKGFMYAMDSQGNMIELQPRALNEGDIEKISNALEYYASTENGNSNTSEVKDSEGEEIVITKGDKKRSLNIFDVIASTVMFGGINNLSEAGRMAMAAENDNHHVILRGIDKATPGNVEAIANENARHTAAINEIMDSSDPAVRANNLIIKDRKKAFYIEQLPNGKKQIVIGSEGETIWKAPLTIDGAINPVIKARLKEFLADRYLQGDSSLLGKGESKAYVHVEAIDPKTGEVKYTDYESYKNYLLTHESNPLRTRQVGKQNKAGYTKSDNHEIPSRVNQYAIIEMPIQGIKPVDPVEPKKEVKKIFNQFNLPPVKSAAEVKVGDTLQVVLIFKGKLKLDASIEVGKAGLVINGELSDDQASMIAPILKASDTGLDAVEMIFDLKEKGYTVNISKSGEVEQSEPAVAAPVQEEDEDDGDPYATNDSEEGIVVGTFRERRGTPTEFENITQARAWFKSRFPNVDFNVVRRLIQGKNEGQMRDAAVYIFENAEIGTTYHEAFHVVSHLFLTNKERNALYAEARRTPGLQTAIQENIKRGMEEWRAVEEALAEEFRDFIMNGGTASFSKTPEKQSFFTRLWNWFKEMVLGRPADIQTVFNRIDTGYYKDNTVKPTGVVLNRGFDTDLPGFSTQAFANDVVQGINYFFFDHFVKNNDEGTLNIFDSSGTTSGITKAYDHARVEFQKQANNPNLKPGVTKYLKFALDNWNRALELHKALLKTYNLDLVEDELVTELDRGNDKGSQFSYESIKFSVKQSATRNIKLLIGSLPSTLAPGSVPVTNSLGFITNVDFGHTFNVLTNALQNTEGVEEVADVVRSLVVEIPGIYELSQRLRLGTTDANNYSAPEMAQLIQFAQTFAKNKNNFEMNLIGSDGHAQTIESNVDTIQNTILTRWKSGAIAGSKGKYADYYNGDGDNLGYRKAAFDRFKSINQYNLFEFLDILGITFDKQNKVDKSDLTRMAGAILSNIKSGKQAFLFSDLGLSKESGSMKRALEVASEVSNDYLENGHFNINGDRVFDQTLNNFLTLTVNRINKAKSLDELRNTLPALNPSNNPFVAGSMVLSRMFKNGRNRLDVKINEGGRLESDGTAVEFNKMSPGDKLSFWVKNIMVGKYPMLRPSDNKLERFIDFGVLFDDASMRSRTYLDQFVTYLEDELVTKVSGILTPWKGTSKNESTGIMLSILSDSEMKIGKDFYAQFTKMVQDGATADQIRAFIQKHKPELKSVIATHFNKVSGNLQLTMLREQLIVMLPDGSFANNGLPFEDNNINKSLLNSFALQTVVNFAAGNIEQMKLIYGNPDMFKGVEDAFKRFSGAMGTKKMMMTDGIVNDFIDKFLKRSDREGQLLDSVAEVGYKKPVVRTIVLNDPSVISDNLALYQKTLGYDESNSFEDNQIALEKASPYGAITLTENGKTRYISASEWAYAVEYNLPLSKKNVVMSGLTESDGFGYITMDEYRESFFRSGEWTFGKGSMEELFQWENQQDLPEKDRVYIDPVSKNTRPIDKRDLIVFNSVKFQHYGNLAEVGSPIGFYKLSVMPLVPSVIKGTNLAGLAQLLKEKKSGMAVYDSSTKVGVKVNTVRPQNVYESDGSTNFDSDLFVTQDSYYENWGIQQDTGNKVKNSVPSGTQMAKHLVNSLFSRGEAITPEMHASVVEYLDLVGQRISQGTQELASKVGLQKDSDGNWDISDYSNLIKKIKDEAIRSNMPDNIIDSIQILEKGLGVDVLLNRDSVEKILASMADHNVIHIKRFGGGKYQGAATMFELGVRKTDYNDGTMSSSDLKFYRNENGSIKQMEIYLPSYFKDHISIGEVDPRLLEVIGFRIPTQGFSSIDSIVVKGFLPKSAGEMVVVPSEIVAKTGSDFDIDKLNIYLPNFYYSQGKPVYIEYGTTNEIEEGYKSYSDSMIETQIEKLAYAKIEGYTDSEGMGIKYVLKSVIEKFRRANMPFTSYDLGIMMDSYAEKEKSRLRKMLIQIADEFKTADDYSPESIMSLETYKRKAIENRMSEISKDILLNPGNFQQLIAPLTVTQLKEGADYVGWLKSGKKGTIDEWKKADSVKTKWHSVLDPSFVLDVSDRFMTGKEAVGITALASTWHVLSQLHNIQINLAASKTVINLPYNKGDKGDTASMADIFAQDGSNIAFTLSQWINASVDAVKDPFMFDYNANSDTLGTILMLVTIGVPIKTIALFMNQPSVVAYINAEKSNDSMIVKANDIEKSKAKLFTDVLQGFPKKSDTKVKLSDEVLESAIVSNSTGRLSQSQIDIQNQILMEFLQYRSIANEIRDAIQGSTFDTNSIGTSVSELLFKIKQAEKALKSDTFINYDKMMGVGEENTFIGHFYHGAVEIKDMYRKLFVSLGNPQFAMVLSDFMDELITNSKSVNKNDVIKAIDAFRTDFITYLLMSRKYKISEDGNLSTTTIKDDRDRLFKGKDSVPARIFAIKEAIRKGHSEGATSLEGQERKDFNKYKNNKFIEYLEPIVNDPKEFSFMKMSVRRLQAMEANSTTDGWRSLTQDGSELGQDIIKFIIIQSGLQSSPMNFIRYLPFEAYGKLIEDIMYRESDDAPQRRSTKLLDYQTYKDAFYFNNYPMNTIMPAIYGYMKPKENLPYYKKNEVKSEYVGKSKVEKDKLTRNGVKIYNDTPTIFPTKEKGKYILKGILKNFRKNQSLQSYGFPNPILTTGTKGTVIQDVTGKDDSDLDKLNEFMRTLSPEDIKKFRAKYLDNNSISC